MDWKFKIWKNSTQLLTLIVPKLTFGPFGVRNGPNLQIYLFHEYISLNPSRVEQNYTIQLIKMAKTNY